MGDQSQGTGNRYEHIQGSNINFGEHHGDVTINYGAPLQKAEDPDRKLLVELLNRLQFELKTAGEADQEAAAAVELFARQAAEQAGKDSPNRTALKITGDSLKAAASNLLSVAPIAVEIANVLLRIQ